VPAEIGIENWVQVGLFLFASGQVSQASLTQGARTSSL
jgi:hypothetical protein